MDKKELLKIQDFDSLLDFLVDELEWPIDIDNFETRDLTFEYSPEEIGLSEELTAKVNSIKQLRPFTSEQPWAIFWMDFEAKNLPITVLRRILRHFVVKKRAADPTRTTWQMEDIMFVSGHGDEETRGVTFAHFKNLDGNEVMREFSWDKRETSFENYISYLDTLKWSDNFENNPKAWSTAWRGAFTGSTREAVRTSKQLAISMAWIARDIRDRVKEVYGIERQKGALHRLYESFREGLIHDMSVDQFADMYAQTMTYGLFSARTMDTDGHFEMHEVADLIPSTNPFLKKLFKECLVVGTDHHQIDLDELGIGRLVDLLDGLNKSDGTDTMTRILEEFGRRTGSGNEDPVIHFYEEFLKEYDQIQRVDKGVYYTPDPVVDFIVRSVNEQLKTEFGLEMGLADTTTWEDMVASGRAEWPKDPKTGKSNQNLKDKIGKIAFVQILDPATGTGTFLIRTITIIHEEVRSKHKRDNIQTPWLEYWNQYVESKLFPRLFGFELMMASCSVAHMRIGMHLKSLGYDFKKGQRLNVYLTNTLESPDEMGSADLFFSSIGAEAESAKLIKSDRFFTAIIGNPPYSGVSSNNGKWISSLIEDYKYIDGEHFGERKHWLGDDYVKFLRYAQFQISKSGAGLIGYINPHGFLDNPTFRGMRWNILDYFDKIQNIDLHGNGNKKETSPDGTLDANVFDIQQGVSINFFIKKHNVKPNSSGKLWHTDLYGRREKKYSFLIENDVNNLDSNELKPEEPYFFFVPKNDKIFKEYKKGILISDLFVLGNSGIVTGIDKYSIFKTEKELIETTNLILNSTDPYTEFNIKDSRRVSKEGRIEDLKKAKNKGIVRINYRPFDINFMYLPKKNEHWINSPRIDIMQHFLKGNNVGLITARSNKSETCDHFFISKNIMETKCGERTTQSAIFPLYLYPSAEDQYNIEKTSERTSNLNQDIIQVIAEKLNLTFTIEKKKENNFEPIDILDYVYGVLHSPKYRDKYKEFLKIDFPRVPYPKDPDTFWRLVKLGGEIRKIHLLESDIVNNPITEFITSGNNEVTKSMTARSPGWIATEENTNIGDVWINDEQYFSGVPKIAWDFYIGGYQPAQKWLKDRKGRNLSDEDIEHYQKIIVALTETDRIMKEIYKIRIE